MGQRGVAVRAGSDSTDAGVAPHEAATRSGLVGRELAVDRLRVALADARSGSVRVIAVTGRSGCGRSAFLDMALSLARSMGSETRRLDGTVTGRLASSSWVDLSERRPTTVANESIGWLMGYRPVPVEQGDRWEDLLRLDAAPAERPLVIGVDDAECLESGAAAHLAQVCMRSIAERPGGGVVLMTVATDRPDDVGSLASRLLVDGPTTAVVELRPLSSREVGAVVTALAGAPPDPAALHALCALADGLPRRVAAEVQNGLSAGHLRVEGRRLRASPEFRHVARVLTGVVDRALSRYQRLDARSRDAVDLLACCGSVFSLADVGRLLGVGRVEADAIVESSESLLDMDDARVWFIDERVHAAVLAGVDTNRRAQLTGPLLGRLARSADPADLIRSHRLIVGAERPERSDVRIRRINQIALNALSSGCWSDAFCWFTELIETLEYDECSDAVTGEQRAATFLFGGAAALHAGDGACAGHWFDLARAEAHRSGQTWLEGVALLGRCRASILGLHAGGLRDLEPDALAYVDRYGARFPALSARLCGVLAERCFDHGQFEQGATRIAQGRALLGDTGASALGRSRRVAPIDLVPGGAGTADRDTEGTAERSTKGTADSDAGSTADSDTEVTAERDVGGEIETGESSRAALTMLNFAEALLCFGALRMERAHELFAEVAASASASGDDWVAEWARSRRLLVSLGSGSIDGLGARARAAARSASAGGSGSDEGIAVLVDASASLLTGDLRSAERKIRRATAAFEASDYLFGPALVAPLDLAIRLAYNDRVGAVTALSRWGNANARAVSPFWLSLESAFDALHDPSVREPLVGRLRGLVDQVGRRPISVLTAPIWALVADCLISIEICNRIDSVDEPLSTAGLAQLARECTVAIGEMRNRRIEVVGGGVWSTRRLSAGLAALLGDEIGARRLHRDAVAKTLQWGAGPELVRSLLQSGVFLGDGAAALEALTIASQIELAGELTTAERVVARFPPDPTSSFEGTDVGSAGLRFIVFSDLVNSTGLNAMLGDRMFVQLLEFHDRVVRARLAKCGGVEFKHTGDGIASEFLSADAAARFACGLQRDLSPGRPGKPELRVRVGIAAGHPIRIAGDRFGMCVVHAARVCALADAGMVLVGTEVAEPLRKSGFEVAPFGRRHLKGFPEPELIWHVRAHDRLIE